MRVIGASLAMMLGLWVAQTAAAGDGCCGAPEECGRCGCHAACQKYCKMVPDVKEVKKHVWVVKCEDFCAPLPGCGGKRGCGACGDGCGDESCASGCGAHCDRCGCVRTKKTLEKKEIVEKIQCWKCVVVYACGDCGDGCCAEGMAPVKAGETLPAAPLPPGPRAPLPPPPPKSNRQATLEAPLPQLSLAY